jgi:hydrogenase maturation protein HypF
MPWPGGWGWPGWSATTPAGCSSRSRGAAETVERFLQALAAEAPPLAVIERVTATPLAPTGAEGFAIAPSRGGGERQALVSPDTATCADCLAELADPADRRHRYPFTNCTNCGPRFTIVRDVPYDRPATTMAAFAMCPDCAREYHDPAVAASRSTSCAARPAPAAPSRPCAATAPTTAPSPSGWPACSSAKACPRRPRPGSWARR